MFKQRLLGMILIAGLFITQSVPMAHAQTFCDQAKFVSDVTVPDGSTFSPGAGFTKTWRLKNIGSCTWTTSYNLVWAGGDQMGAPASVALPVTVAPGQEVDLSVSLTAPTANGHFKGLWKLSNPSGAQFGIGNSADGAFWVDINVGQNTLLQSSSNPITWVAFDFLEYAAYSQWRSGAGILSFPGIANDSRGFSKFVEQPHLEDGTFDTSRGLLMAPQNKTDGYIQMTSPNILISKGDKLETLVSCEYDAKNCYVTFRIDYLREDGGQIRYWSWKEAFDGRYYRASIDLSPLAGKAVRFVFMTLATGSASGDRALWVAPRIIRTTGGDTPVPPTPTPVPGPTQTPPSGGVVTAPYIRQLYMKDALNGWAIGDSYILRTTNGGATWTNVSPPNVAYTSGVTGFFSNSTTGWVLTGESKLYRTTNGGKTWSAYSVPFPNGYMQFTDSYHGFVLSGLGSGMNKQAVALYKTNDGGATWIKNYDNTPTLPNPGTSLPFSGHKNGMTFRDSLNGWVGGDIPMDGFVYLFRTVNAGKDWSQQALALPSGYESAFISTKSPIFFGSLGVLPVWMNKTEGRDLYTYSTTNGGTSWTRSSGYARGAEFVDFVTSKIGFAWDHSGIFQMTTNAGANWTQIKPNISFGDDFRGMDFVSSTTGWVIQRHADNSTSLYKTTDGAVTWTLLSTNKPGGTPSDTPVPSACDKAAFVADVTILDGTLFAPGTPFTKTWRLKNTGTCTWTTSYKLVFQSGDQMGAPASINLPVNVPPDQTIDISAPMTAPATAGKYRGYWILNNASGAQFGIGANSNSPFWVEINVSADTTTNIAYDFTANVCAAQWKSGTGTLPCPGTEGSSTGFVVKLDAPVMEDGSVGAPGLLTSPQNKYDGYIQGFYPEFTVQAGDRFQTKVGCQQGQNCYVTYRLNYMTANGWIGTFWQWREANDGKYYTADIDLTPLAGKKVRFILTILATGYATGDRAIWSAPRIYRAGAGTQVTVTPPPTATFTPTPQTSTWLTFASILYGFQFQYPPGTVAYNQVANSAILNMPITPGTTLVEKYLDLRMLENVETCAAPMVGASPVRETVTINGVTFLKDTGMEGGMSQTRKWVAYNTTRNNLCVSFLFVLHSAHAFDPPRPDYDEAAESAVFLQMMQSFAWLTPTSTTPVSLLPDLTISQMRIELQNTSCLNPGDSLGVRVWVTNNGQAAAGNFTVTVNNTSQSVTGLAVGETKALYFPNYTNPVSAMVDSTSVVAESNETNNTRNEMVAVPTAPLPCASPTPSVTPSVPQDFTTFGQNLVTVLNGKSFDLAKGMMDQTFGFAFWGSEGYASTPDQAVDTLRINYIGSTPLSPNPYKDLNALLDGMNPYQIMNLDPAKSQALFVSGWGLDGKGEAILYMTRRADNSIYWHSVLIAPTGFQQVTLTGPYAVVNVAENDSLNVRAGAGVNQPILGFLSPDAADVMRTGPSQTVEGAVWVEIRRNDGLTGWVNSFYLTEYVTHEAFCADTRVTALLDQLKQSMQQSNGTLLSPIVSPIHGVNMHLWAYGPGINFLPNKVAGIYTDPTVYSWGGGPSGQPDTGTFNDRVKPKYLEVFNAANRETYCDTLTKVFPLSRPWPYRNIHYYNLYKPATPDIFFDFRTLLVGIEYVDGKPYLYGMVTIIWEP